MDLTYKIIKHLGTLSTRMDGYTREVNIIASPTATQPRVDIRDWPPDKKKMGRGITLTIEEAELLAVLLLENLQFKDVSNERNDNNDLRTD